MPGYVYKGTHTGPDLFDPVPRQRRDPSPCGTVAGHRRHMYHKETPCPACTKAYEPILRPCGTPAAARRHERAGEPICQECREGVRKYRAALRRRD